MKADNAGITDNDREIQDRIIAEQTSRAGADGGEEKRKSPYIGRFEGLLTLKLSDRYIALLEEHEIEYLSYKRNNKCGHLVAKMYDEIRRQYPDLSNFDIAGRILLDTRERWVMRTALDTIRFEGKERSPAGRAKKCGPLLRPAVSTAADDDEEDEGKAELCDGMDSNSGFHITSIRSQDFSGDLTCTLFGRIVDRLYMMVNDKDEVIEVSSDREELERICRSFKK